MNLRIMSSGLVAVGVGVFLLPVFCGCQKSSEEELCTPVLESSLVDGQRAMSNVVRLVKFTPRDSGSVGAREAARFLRRALKPCVDRCRIDEFKDDTPRGTITFRNVIGVLRGSSSNLVIVASHYDTKSGIDNFQGANDSGSSTGLLLELARVLHASPRLPFTVIFVFFDGEECIEDYGARDGLHGSRRFVRQLRQQGRVKSVRAMILLDMVGDRDLCLTLPRNVDGNLRRMTIAAAREAGIRKKVALAGTAVLDDHVPFLDAGIPAIDLIDFDYGSAPGLNDYWHTSADSLEHISASSLADSGRIVIGILNRLAGEQDGKQ